MDRRVGITRCRAPILLSCLCLDSCTRVQRSIVLEILEREREREGGERSSSISGKSVFHHRGERGFVEGVPDPSMAVLASRNGIPVLLAIFCVVAGAGTRTHVRREICLLARRVQSTAIVCGSVMAIGYGKQGGGWINFWLWVFCFRGSRDSWGIRDSGKYWESCDLASGELFIRRNLVQIYKYIVFLVTHIVVRYYLISFDSFFFFLLEISKFREGMRLIDFILFIS